MVAPGLQPGLSHDGLTALREAMCGDGVAVAARPEWIIMRRAAETPLRGAWIVNLRGEEGEGGEVAQDAKDQGEYEPG